MHCLCRHPLDSRIEPPFREEWMKIFYLVRYSCVKIDYDNEKYIKTLETHLDTDRLNWLRMIAADVALFRRERPLSIQIATSSNLISKVIDKVLPLFNGV